MPTSLTQEDLQILLRMVDSRLAALYTIEVGKVTSYDPQTVRASVQLQVRRRKGNDDLIEPGVCKNIPAWRWMIGPFYAHAPFKVGDAVIVGFMDRDTSGWFDSGETKTPAKKRAFDVNDGVILGPVALTGSLAPDDTRNGEDFTFGTVDGKLAAAFTPNGDIEFYGAGSVEFGAFLGLGVKGARIEFEGSKLAIGNGTIELLDQVSSDIGQAASLALQLSTATTATAIGSQPLSIAPQLATIQTQLLAIKAKVALLKK